MNLNLKDKRAVVFGSSNGLGRAIAESLVAEGAKVAISSRNQENLNRAQKEIGAQLTITADLTIPGSAAQAVEKVIQQWGGVDIVVCNTGGPPKGLFADVGLKQWQDGFQNLWLSTVEALHAALPSMKKQNWGRVLLVTSVAAREPMPGLTVSNGLRAGLLGMVNSASREYAPFGITINALLPGYTKTERLKELHVPEEKMTSLIPAGRLGEPGELGSLATFLASEKAAYITGQAIAIDGGYLHSI